MSYQFTPEDLCEGEFVISNDKLYFVGKEVIVLFTDNINGEPQMNTMRVTKLYEVNFSDKK